MLRTTDFGQLFYTAPALLIELVKKCQNASHKIPLDIAEMLKKMGLIEGDTVPKSIRGFVLSNIFLTDDGGISMTL